MNPEMLMPEAISGQSADSPAAPIDAGQHGHIATMYDDEDDLIRAVAVHVFATGLTAGQRVIIVATPEHREAIEQAAAARGADLTVMRRAGDYVVLDAAETLARFMVDGSPDVALFAATLGPVLQSESGNGQPPRVFGEMVALLWHAGDVSAALELEVLWNDLAREHRFSLLCGYPMAALEGHADLAAVRDVCQVHAEVVPPRRYRPRGSTRTTVGDAQERAEVFLSLPEAVGGVRRWLRTTLRQWGEHSLIDDISVVASELATNAIRHAQSPFRVTVSRNAPRRLRLMVEDLSTSQPALDPRETDDLGGRGVHLVAQLADRWGIDTLATGKRVWAEFDSPVGDATLP